jgi:hypothetical protein
VDVGVGVAVGEGVGVAVNVGVAREGVSVSVGTGGGVKVKVAVSTGGGLPPEGGAVGPEVFLQARPDRNAREVSISTHEKFRMLMDGCPRIVIG